MLLNAFVRNRELLRGVRLTGTLSLVGGAYPNCALQFVRSMNQLIILRKNLELLRYLLFREGNTRDEEASRDCEIHYVIH